MGPPRELARETKSAARYGHALPVVAAGDERSG
jgi:hypothetical protein